MEWRAEGMKRRRLLARGLSVGAGLTAAVLMPQRVRAAGSGAAKSTAGKGGGERGRRPVLMIDPGHGGADPGAIGPTGLQEKEVTLAVARALANRLNASGQVTAALTRSDDRFMELAERVHRARVAQAHLLLSIHADSAPTPAARGFSAYTLAESASDPFAAALARRENLADGLGGARLEETPPEVAAILFDLAVHRTRSAAAYAQAAVVRGVDGRLPLLERPKRSANFAILKAPDIPSILLEIGFLSNASDERRLGEAEGRAQVAEVLAGVLSRLLDGEFFN